MGKKGKKENKESKDSTKGQFNEEAGGKASDPVKEEKEEKQETQEKKEENKADDKEKEDVEGKLQSQLAEMNDKYLRLYSDFDNYRKRANKEKLEMIKTASSGVVLALLPVIDDMERAIKAFQDTLAADAVGEAPAGDSIRAGEEGQKSRTDALFEGVNLIYNKLIGVLRQQGVKECEVMGKAFDAEVAEAVAQIPAPEESLKGVVLDVVQKGYAIEEKVIRYAKVVVGC